MSGEIDRLSSLADRHYTAGQFDDAQKIYKQILSQNSSHANSLHKMGLIASAAGRGDIAKKLLDKAAEVFYKTGLQLKEEKKIDDAIRAFSRSVVIKPSADAYIQAGILFQATNRYEEAVFHYKSALALDPQNIEAKSNLAAVYCISNMFEEARDICLEILAQDPNHTYTLNTLASCCTAFGQMDQAIECRRRALALNPYEQRYHNNLLMAMVYAASVTPEELSQTARNFGKNLADPLSDPRDFKNDKNPERKLRIGYVSPDFIKHSVNYFFEPLLKNHDRKNFEFFAYSNAIEEDEVTQRLKREFNHWRDIVKIDGMDVVNIIMDDQIDILVDLTGHTGRNRLLVFARRAAPVQVTWLGWPATTGMKAMDYRITDHYAEPEGMTENLNAEALWRLPGLFCCYKSQDTDPPVIDHPPFEDNGCITFGCFNNFSKVTDPVLAAWSEIMARVPKSRLLLEIAGLEGPKFRAELDERFRRFGFPMDRLILEPRKPENRLVFYNRIDIALDPFPCNGGTTSMDTLWMGVPFVTLEGRHFVSRMGVSILSNVGLPELIAKDTDEYIEKAVSLATDRDRLRAIRHNLRQRVEQSPMMDQKSFARNMEAAYRGMWRKWCETQ